MRTFLIFFLIATPVFASTVANPSQLFPPPLSALDFKKEIPFAAPQRTKAFKKRVAPNVDPLIDQIIRRSELDQQLQVVMPWVYSQGLQSEIADYEEAVTNLEIADHCLLEAMQGMLNQEADSLQLDPLIITAKFALDDAEFVVFYLNNVSQFQNL